MFGMVDVSHEPALGYMEIVQRRNAATLLPINSVQSLPSVATHETVNHSLHFVDPVTGVHTQNVESYWNRVKIKLKRMKGCHTDKIPEYLDEFVAGAIWQIYW